MGKKKFKKEKKRGEHAWVLPLAKEKEKKRKRSVTRTVHMVIVFFFRVTSPRTFSYKHLSIGEKKIYVTDREWMVYGESRIGKP